MWHLLHVSIWTCSMVVYISDIKIFMKVTPLQGSVSKNSLKWECKRSVSKNGSLKWGCKILRVLHYMVTNSISSWNNGILCSIIIDEDEPVQSLPVANGISWFHNERCCYKLWCRVIIVSFCAYYHLYERCSVKTSFHYEHVAYIIQSCNLLILKI